MKNKLILQTILSAILASIAIGIGGICYLTTGQAWTFSIGLLTIAVFNLQLFTGKVSYMNWNDTPKILLILVCNMLAAWGMGVFIHFTFPQLVAYSWPVVSAKMTEGWLVLPRAILCNAMIFIAIDSWKKLKTPNNLLVLVFACTVFVLCGFEHCVANAFYFGVSLTHGWNILPFFGLNILGNAIGGILSYRLTKAVEPKLS
jgi:formate/nitrite transporter FocA (FNT family)